MEIVVGLGFVGVCVALIGVMLILLSIRNSLDFTGNRLSDFNDRVYDMCKPGPADLEMKVRIDDPESVKKLDELIRAIAETEARRNQKPITEKKAPEL